MVAERMRETLVEVLGEDRGASMYTMEWLRNRVRFHLDPTRSTAAVFVAEDASGRIDGHTIVRLERDEEDRAYGLFSTTYVAPDARRAGLATSLLRRGEAWMLEHGLTTAATATSSTNEKLIRLYEGHGYAITHSSDEMVRLEKELPRSEAR